MLAEDPVCHWPYEYQHSASGKELRYESFDRICMNAATVADHIKPRSLYPELAYTVSNGQGLCATHHNAKTAEEKRGIYRSTK